jgi:two-component system sensor histidine kinase PhoQ
MFDRDDVIEFWVEDDGPGVANDQQAVIMKRGVRLDVKPSGHGIGLAVVSEIAERYEGEVSVSRSERLGGARFSLTLKLAR